MSININKYGNRDEFLSDGNKPQDECCVSQIDRDIVYEGKNVMLSARQLNEDDVCLVFKEAETGKILFTPIDNYVANNVDSEKYQIKEWVRFGSAYDKQFLIHKDAVLNGSSSTMKWTEWNRYRLSCDTSASGSFDWSITINGTVKSGSVSWSANDTLDSIVEQLNEGKVNTYLVFSHVGGESFVRIQSGGYTNSTFTLSNSTGTTLEDLSVKCKIDGVVQTEMHRTWQAQDVSTLFPSLGFVPASSTQYSISGLNLSYRCGCNLDKYKSYYSTNGSSSYISETTPSSRMSKSGFASLKYGSADAVALYNKYNGSWDAYMEASMVSVDDFHHDGMEYRSYDNGNEQSHMIDGITTETFDGSYIPVYIASYEASRKSDADLGVGGLPSNHELAIIMDSRRMAKINKAFSAFSTHNLLSNSTSYWGVAQYTAYGSWLYYGTTGTLNSNNKYYGYGVRSTLAFVQ